MYFLIRIFFFDTIPYRLDQMSLAESGASIYEKWIVFSARIVNYGLGGGIRKLIESSDDKRFEMVARV